MGGWVDDNGELIKETHIRVEAYGDIFGMNYPQRAEFIEVLNMVLANQDCIFVDYDGTGRLLFNAVDVLDFSTTK